MYSTINFNSMDMMLSWLNSPDSEGWTLHSWQWDASSFGVKIVALVYQRNQGRVPA